MGSKEGLPHLWRLHKARPNSSKCFRGGLRYVDRARPAATSSECRALSYRISILSEDSTPLKMTSICRIAGHDNYTYNNHRS